MRNPSFNVIKSIGRGNKYRANIEFSPTPLDHAQDTSNRLRTYYLFNYIRSLRSRVRETRL